MKNLNNQLHHMAYKYHEIAALSEYRLLCLIGLKIGSKSLAKINKRIVKHTMATVTHRCKSGELTYAEGISSLLKMYDVIKERS